MKLSDIPLRPTNRMLRQFAAALLVLSLVWAVLLFPAVRARPVLGALFGGLALLGAAGLLWPRAVRWPFIAATVVTFPIGLLVTQLILLVMFYLVITPIGLVLRSTGRDPLQRHRDPRRVTWWAPRRETPDPERYLKQF